MKYTVSINEKKRTVTVNLDGYEGVARCCPTDCFNVQTGVELALERARVAKANAENAKKAAPVGSMANQMSVTMLAEQLEKTLGKGSIVVAVGGGDKCLTDGGRKWLAELAGKYACKCDKECLSEDEIEEITDTAYDEGHNDGKREGREEALDYVRTHIGELVASWVEELAEAVDECLDEAAENMAD